MNSCQGRHYINGWEQGMPRRPVRGSVFKSWGDRQFLFIHVHLVLLAWYTWSAITSSQGFFAYVNATLVENTQGLLLLLIVDLLYLAFFSNIFGTVYIIDYATCKPDAKFHITHENFMKLSKASGFFNDDGLLFQEKLLNASCIGDGTFFPEGILKEPPELNMEMARKEAEYIFDSTLTELFSSTKVKPQDIDFLIVNCSLFCPTPSLSAIIVRQFRMKEGIKSFNLGGMGCSASPIAIDLACTLLSQKPGSIALVVSTENITQNWYQGKEKGMLISNVLFRMGGAAVLLTNKVSWRGYARAKVLSAHRVHRGANEEAYNAVYQEQDSQNKIGVRLSKEIVRIAQGGIVRNLYHVGRRYLPYHTQISYFLLQAAQKLYARARKHAEVNNDEFPTWWKIIITTLSVIYGQGMSIKSASYGDKAPEWLYAYPDFQATFKWFCIHCAGKKIIEVIGEKMKLSDESLEPSYATLYNHGNVSSSSIWYELDYIERVLANKVRSGDRVLMMAFGSGFKCNTLVLQLC